VKIDHGHCFHCGTQVSHLEEDFFFWCSPEHREVYERAVRLWKNPPETFGQLYKPEPREVPTREVVPETTQKKKLGKKGKRGPKKSKRPRVPRPTSPMAPDRRLYVCRQCGELGHNRRTCKSR
jgi:hypothetical protein